MAYVIKNDVSTRFSYENGKWVEHDLTKPRKLCSLFWDTNTQWDEATHYLGSFANKPRTAEAKSEALVRYANWLEDAGENWTSFPIQDDEKVTYKFRDWLMDESNLACSTQQNTMSEVVRFYKHCEHYKLIGRETKWEDKVVSVNVGRNDDYFRKMVTVMSTNLAIRCPKPSRFSTVEGGLRPIRDKDRDALLGHLKQSDKHSEMMMYWMFLIGFTVGARSESIRTLRPSDLNRAVQHHMMTNIYLIKAGPGTNIKTKQNISLDLHIPEPVLEKLRYFCGINEKPYTKPDSQFIEKCRRIRDERLEKWGEGEAPIFITSRGKQYEKGTFTKLISNLKKDLTSAGLPAFASHQFHDTRATCGSNLAYNLIQQESDTDAIAVVSDWLGHKHQSTTWKYIKFHQHTKRLDKVSKLWHEWLGFDGDAS